MRFGKILERKAGLPLKSTTGFDFRTEKRNLI